MAQRGDHALIGLDVNSSRARLVGGPPGRVPVAVPVADGEEELPLALSLQGRHPEAGRAGLALSRRAPHQACLDFLPHLGTPRQWRADRHRLDAGQALELVLQRLPPAGRNAGGLVLAVPAYLALNQVHVLAEIALKAKLPVLGSVAAPLASALAAHGERPWHGTAVVIDLDSHALTLTPLRAGEGLVQVLDVRVLPTLNLRAWKDRLLAGVADRCIRQSRRDPRDSAAAEQSLYDDLEGALDACRQGRMAELVVQTPQWYQNLIFQPEDLVRFCAPLTRAVLEALEAVRAATRPNEVPHRVLLTAAAGRLPGLVPAVQVWLAESAPAPEEPAAGEDFGEHLLDDDPSETPLVTVLAPDAAARGAHALAGRFLGGELRPGHLDARAPVPPPQPPEAGPARLHFRGQDFLLGQTPFVLGRQPACDLVFDSETYPSVSGCHCEILYDHRTYFLRDRSRHGTLVNDRPVAQQVSLCPGDYIRLGPGGPLLRFLGQAADPRRLMTIA